MLTVPVSGIPDGATVTGASLFIYPHSWDTNNSHNLGLTVSAHSPVSVGTYSTADYDLARWGTTAFGSIAQQSDVTLNAYNEIPLNTSFYSTLANGTSATLGMRWTSDFTNTAYCNDSNRDDLQIEGTNLNFPYTVHPPYLEVFYVMPACDFSFSDGHEWCFGGIGRGCAGIPLLPFVEDDQTCLVAGWVSAGSILHDRCCLETNQTGYFCSGSPVGNGCKKEWKLAVADVESFFLSLCVARGWSYAFGPYPVGTMGDDTTRDLPAPPGARLDPKYESLCASGRCQVDRRGKTVIKKDECGKYCECW
jgi:hypothetical protein